MAMISLQKRALVVCGVVTFLGLVCAALAFAAEGTKPKVSEVHKTPDGQCIYPKTPATSLALYAVLFLMIDQAIISVASGCICCKNHTYASSRIWAVELISFTVSWITFLLAFFTLLSGAALSYQSTVLLSRSNGQGTEQYTYFTNYCFVAKSGVFAFGAVLSMASIALSIVYYIASEMSKVAAPAASPQNEGVAMGTAEVPRISAEPVFVHEDTYKRQQFP